eukprot:snap_masked-scaffold_3-processed-gene-1.13-mRNA-1 protein AED:1.00 eAED:1.00 QI:0/-1/0/0/-1/1/1/0/229
MHLSHFVSFVVLIQSQDTENLDLHELDKNLPPLGGYEGDPTDMKYILCETCEALLNASLKILTHEINSNQKLKKNKFLSTKILENSHSSICDASTEIGSWITKYDIDESTDYLKLIKKKKKGKCKSKCKTIEMTCEEVFKEAKDAYYLTIISKAKQFNYIFNKRSKDLLFKDLREEICMKKLSKAGFYGSCGREINVADNREKFNEEWERESKKDSWYTKITNLAKLEL